MPFFGSSKGNYECRVIMLDSTEKHHTITNKTYAHELLWKILASLELYEKEYFGIKYKDRNGSSQWLVLHKKITKQVDRNDSPYVFYFCVKFYAADPTKLREVDTRYQFFLQVKRDILQGRIACDQKTIAELSAYAVQSELGDYDPAVHTDNFLSEFRFVPSQTVELEKLIQEKYEKLRGMHPAKAELKFLERVRWLDTYGVDFHPVRGQDNVEYFLGLTPTGIVLYKKKNKIGSFIWLKVTKLKYKGSCFLLRATQGRNDEEKEYAFICSTKENAKSLWKLCAEQHTFFKMEKANNMPASGFNLLFPKATGSNMKESDNQITAKRTQSQKYFRKDEFTLSPNSHNRSAEKEHIDNNIYENHTSMHMGNHKSGYSSAGEAEQKRRRGHYYSGYTNIQSDHEGGRTKSRYGSAPNVRKTQEKSNRNSRQYSQESLYPNSYQANGHDARAVRPSGTKSDGEESNRRRRHQAYHRHSAIPNGNQTDTEMVPALDVYRNTVGVAVNENEEHGHRRYNQNGKRHGHRHSQYAYDPSQAEVLLELGPPSHLDDNNASKTNGSSTPPASEKESVLPGTNHHALNTHYVHQQPLMPYGIPHGLPPGHTPPQFFPHYYPPHVLNQVRHQMMHMHDIRHQLYHPQYMGQQHISLPKNTSPQKLPNSLERSSSRSPPRYSGGNAAANYSVSTEL